MVAHSYQISQNELNLIKYAEAENVPSSTLTTILTYTATADTYISLITCSGQDYAKFELYIDTILIATKRTGPKRNTEWNYSNPLLLSAGSILDIKVTHYYTGDLSKFEAALYASN